MSENEAVLDEIVHQSIVNRLLRDRQKKLRMISSQNPTTFSHLRSYLRLHYTPSI